MIPQWIIEKKRDGQALSAEEIRFFINGFVRGDIPDYQAAAFAMAVFFRGMAEEEIVFLTEAMLNSGAHINLSSVPLPKADKHSTGGIGDKISIPLAPLAACCGLAVPMIAGRGLGITGGTIDKLESIPGYRTALSEREFEAVVAKCGCSIIGQSENIAPADRKLYALRDVTGTVPSIPLIAASILSKKLAVTADALVFDVKCGTGAFMQTLPEAETLARTLAGAAKRMGRRTAAFITPMDQPLGRAVGNALEIAEAVEILAGTGPEDVRELTLELCAQMQILAGIASDAAAAKQKAAAELDSGRAFERFKLMVELHGGAPHALGPPFAFKPAPVQKTVTAPRSGHIAKMDAGNMGRAALLLGAGRRKITDAVDHAAGISGLRKTGEHVEKGGPLCVIHAQNKQAAQAAAALVLEACEITAAAVPAIHPRPQAP